MSAPEVTPEVREALAKWLYDAEGFHAADHWGVESSITRGRYEAHADAALAALRAEWQAEALREAADEVRDTPAELWGVPLATGSTVAQGFFNGASAACSFAERVLRGRADTLGGPR